MGSMPGDIEIERGLCVLQRVRGVLFFIHSLCIHDGSVCRTMSRGNSNQSVKKSFRSLMAFRDVCYSISCFDLDDSYSKAAKFRPLSHQTLGRLPLPTIGQRSSRLSLFVPILLPRPALLYPIDWIAS